MTGRLNTKNRKKIYRELPSEYKREIEIHFTILYKSKLYANFHYSDDEMIRLHCMRFILSDENELLNKEIEPDGEDNLFELMSLIEDAGNYEPGQHFIWLEDKQSLILKDRILENNQERLIKDFYNRTGKERKAIQKGVKTISILLLLYIVVVGICANAKAWETILQYRYFTIGTVRLSAYSIRFFLLLIYILVWLLFWNLLKNKPIVTRICACLVGTFFLSAGSAYFASVNANKLINDYADSMEYMYSIVQAEENEHRDIYVELYEEKVVIPIRVFKEKSNEPIKYEAWLERNSFPNEVKRYTGIYNELENVVEIEVPELVSNYEYGLLTIVNINNPMSQTVITLGTRPMMWYQKLLGTTAGFKELCSADLFEEAINSKKVSANKCLLELWSFFININASTLFISVYRLWIILLGLCAIYYLAEDYNDKYAEEWIITTKVEMGK